VAEDVTSRFLNVIGLFNGFIPLVAIQMNALKHENVVSLVFTTVLDQMTLGLDDEDEEAEVTDRAYWEKKATPETVKWADQLLGMIHSFDPGFEFKYNKYYISLTKDGQTNNFVTFRPQKNAVRIEVRLHRSQELETRIEDEGLDILDFNRWGKYRIRLAQGDLEQHKDFIQELLIQAHHEAM